MVKKNDLDKNEEVVKEKKVLKLNPIEWLAYTCMKTVFVGGFLTADLLDFSRKNEE